MNRERTKWLVLWAIVILWLLGGIGLLLEIQSDIKPEERHLEVVKTGLLILGGLGVVLPVYLSSWQAIENNLVINDKIAFDKRENSYRLIDKWDDPSLIQARDFIRELLEQKNTISDTELINRINSNPQLRASSILLFNFWERMRISIVYERVDEIMLKLAFKEAFLTLFPAFTPWLKTIVITPQTYNDLKKLYDAWYSNTKVQA